MCDAGVAHEPPRSTSWLHMNFALYSPSAPAAGRDPGIGRVRALRPLPDVAEALSKSRAGHRRAAGGSVSLSRKLPSRLLRAGGDLPLGLGGQAAPAQRA